MTTVEILLDMLRPYFPEVDFGEETKRRRRSREAREIPETGEPETPQARPSADPELARCYAELGVPYGADFRQVRRAWRSLMRQHHPDLQGEDAERQRIGTERTQRFNRAFEEIARRLRGGKGGLSHA